MFEGTQIVIELPFEYAQRDQLLQFMKSKFPGAEILLKHAEVKHPEVSETLVDHDSTAHSSNAEAVGQSQDATTMMQEAAEVLSQFTKSVNPIDA